MEKSKPMPQIGDPHDNYLLDSAAYERFADGPLPAREPWPDPVDAARDREWEKSGRDPAIKNQKETHEPCPT